MKIVIIICIFAIIIEIILAIIISKLKELTFIKIKINKGEENITNTLTKKYHILEEYLNYLKNKIDIKEEDLPNNSLLENTSIYELNKNITIMNNNVDNYISNNEKLLKNKKLKTINKELLETNITITGYKKYYNNNIELHNKLIKKFPSNILAKILKYEKLNPLETNYNDNLKILNEKNE